LAYLNHAENMPSVKICELLRLSFGPRDRERTDSFPDLNSRDPDVFREYESRSTASLLLPSQRPAPRRLGVFTEVPVPPTVGPAAPQGVEMVDEADG
jgi:hypothetical protein